MNPDPNIDATPSTSPVPGQTIQPAAVPGQAFTPNVASPAPSTDNFVPAAAAPVSLPNPTQPVVNNPMIPPTQPYTTPTPPYSPKSHKRLFVAIASIVVLAILAAGGYFLYARSNPSTDKTTPVSSTDETSENGSAAKPLSSLDTFTLSGFAPDGYTAAAGANNTATFKEYSQRTGDVICAISFGTMTAAQAPGATVDELMKKNIDSYKANGGTITGPKAGKDLILGSSVNGVVTQYSMPTSEFDIVFKETNGHAAFHYNAVILKNGDRAIIARGCANKSGQIDSAKLAQLDTEARKIIVTVTP